jgi:hypothetical protein
MPVFEIEMLWDCHVCQAKGNHGLEKHCRNCGHPKDDQDREYMPERVSYADALEGEKQRRAEAGPDWKCKYCGSLQSSLNKCCTECGVPQGADAKKSWTAQTEDATFDAGTGRQTSHSAHIEQIEAPVVPGSQPITAAPVTREPPRRERASHARGIGIVALSILALSVVFWFLLRTKIVDARVTAVSWVHAVKIERRAIHHHEDWDPFEGAFNVTTTSKFHHYDKVKVGEHTETSKIPFDCRCTTIKGHCSITPVSCTSNKNGTARCSGGDKVCDPDTEKCETCYKDKRETVEDFEDRPVYRDYYNYDLWEWDYNRTVQRAGSTVDEAWPSPDELKPTSLGEGETEREEEGGRFTEHHVSFTDGHDQWTLSPSSCQEFERYPPGGHWRIKVGLARGVEVLGPR